MFPPLQSPLSTQWESCWQQSLRLRPRQGRAEGSCIWAGGHCRGWVEDGGGRLEVTPAGQSLSVTDGEERAGQGGRKEIAWCTSTVMFNSRPERIKVIWSRCLSIAQVCKVYTQGFIGYLDIRWLWYLTSNMVYVFSAKIHSIVISERQLNLMELVFFSFSFFYSLGGWDSLRFAPLPL